MERTRVVTEGDPIKRGTSSLPTFPEAAVIRTFTMTQGCFMIDEQVLYVFVSRERPSRMGHA